MIRFVYFNYWEEFNKRQIFWNYPTLIACARLPSPAPKTEESKLDNITNQQLQPSFLHSNSTKSSHLPLHRFLCQIVHNVRLLEQRSKRLEPHSSFSFSSSRWCSHLF